MTPANDFNPAQLINLQRYPIDDVVAVSKQ